MKTKISLVVLFLFVYFFVSFFYVFSVEAAGKSKFLSIPFPIDTELMQGWYYTWGQTHGATDYYCDIGDPIYAAADGLAMSSIQMSDPAYSYGNFVFIRHENGYSTLYAHLNSSSATLKHYDKALRGNTNYYEWTQVKKGDYLGDCGMDGTTNSHLHFEVTTGVYATGRVDPYDLYSTKQYYYPNLEYKSLGVDYLWETEPPRYLLDVKPGKIKEQKETATFYSLSFLNTPQTIQVTPGQEVNVTVEFKNIGTKTLEQNKILANIVGVVNTQFRHSSWVTDLRPAVLDKNIESGQNGVFSFFINAPKDEGKYTFQVMAVENGVWRQIGNDIFVLNMDVVQTDNYPSVRTDNNPSPDDQKNIWNDIADIVKGIKETAEDAADSVVDTVKRVFNGGGGGGSSSEQVIETADESSDEPWFSITTPSSTSWITNSATTTISGEKSTGVEKIFINSSTDGVEYVSSTFWQKQVSLMEGENSFEIYIKDEEEEPISGANLTILLDTVLPTQPLVQSVQNEFTTPTMHVSWTATDLGSEIAYYEVQYRTTNDADWIQLFSSTTSTGHTMAVERSQTYNVRVRAVDKAGNYSLWSDEDADVVSLTIDWPKDVVINEIAWSGISDIDDCAEKEWIELYNPGNQDILLGGWSFVIDGKTILLSNTIPAKGYYLVEKNKDMINGVAAYVLSSEEMDLSDTGGHIVLQNSEGEIVDETNQSTGWLAGSAGSKHHSMERLSYARPGNEISNWQTNESVRYGLTSQCGVVHGSPGTDNNTYWYLSDLINNYNFDENNVLVLGAEHNPYILGYDVTVPEGYELQIDPGAVVVGVADKASLIVSGSVVLNGVSENPVVFTSARDNTYGNWYTSGVPGSLSSSTPQTGDWRNIIVKETGVLDGQYVKFLYGGNTYKYASCFVCHTEQVIRNEGGTVNLNNAVFDNIYVKESNDTYDAYVWSDGGSIDIIDSIFANGYRGIIVEEDAQVYLSGNLFSNFNYLDKYPVELTSVLPKEWKENGFENNFYNGAYISAVTLDEDYILESGADWLFSGIIVSSSSTLTLLPGSQVNLTPAAWVIVEGNLDSQGTPDNPVHINSTQGFGALVFKNSNSNLSHTRISNGGYHNTYPVSGNKDKATLWAENSNLTLDNVSITNSRRPGYIIYSQNSNLNILDSDFGWSEGYEKLSSWSDNGLKLKDSSVYLSNVNFHKMDFVVEGLGDYAVTYDKMSELNFIDMYYRQQYKNWYPADLFDFNLWGGD